MRFTRLPRRLLAQITSPSHSRRLLLPSAALLIVPALAAQGCSSKSTPAATTTTPDAGTDGPAAVTNAVAHFDLPTTGAPDILQVPFPSDTMLAADGTITVPVGTSTAPTALNNLIPSGQGATFLSQGFATTHGFGTYGGAIFAIDNLPTGVAIDNTKLPAGKAGDCTASGSPIFYVDLDATGGAKALECKAFWSDDNVYNANIGTQPVLTVDTGRGIVLPEGHQIAVLLTGGVVDTTGKAIVASSGFVAVRDGTRSDGAATAYATAIAAAATAAGIDKSTVVSAAVYTTGHVTDEARQARDLAVAQAVPALAWDTASVAPVSNAHFTSTTPLPSGWAASLDALLGTPNKLTTGPNAGQDDPDADGSTNPGVAHDAILSVGTASFQAPNFLISKTNTYADPTHATFFHDPSGNVAINPDKPTATIWVTFVVPNTPMPPNGFPVVVFQHGMGGQRNQIMWMANSFAHQGWATAAIELVESGTRGDDASFRGDTHNNSMRSTSHYDGPDGFTDFDSTGDNFSPINLFGGLYRIPAMRDQFRQSAIDHATLEKLLASGPTLDGLAQGGVTPKLDGTHVAYTGDSLGGIIGSLVAGLEVPHAAYVLNVTGAGLLREVGPNSPNIYALLGGSASLNFGFTNVQFPPGHPMLEMMQHMVDGGDPINAASTAILAPLPVSGTTPAARNVLVYEVLADELVPNESGEALARAMGLGMMTPHAPLYAPVTEVTTGVHDSPVTGSTGVIIQLYPASHGSDLYAKPGYRDFSITGPDWTDSTGEVFPLVKPEITFDNPYLTTQAAAIAFITDAFAGKAPTVNWTLVAKTPSDTQ